MENRKFIQQNKHLQKLRKMVLNSEDISEPFDKFFSLLEAGILNLDDHRPIDTGMIDTHIAHMLDAVSHGISDQIGKRDQSPYEYILFEVPGFGLFHGACFPGKNYEPVQIIYFSSVQTGVFRVQCKKSGTDFIRFMLAQTSDIQTKH